MLPHLDEKNRPHRVDPGGKAPARREAIAGAVVKLPVEAGTHFRDGDFETEKGPVFQTAKVAGIMAAKKTSELIPLCHAQPLEECRIEIVFNENQEALIECRVACHHRNGAEMEALTGATVAALTIYDMCKSMSHPIVIGDIRLLEKSGAKNDFRDSAFARDPAD